MSKLLVYMFIINIIYIQSNIPDESIKYIGEDDKDLKKYEDLYSLNNGISYNSYVIDDEKILIIDTINEKFTNQWLSNLEKVLQGKIPSYIVIQHFEPSHTLSLKEFLKKYPNVEIISSTKSFQIMTNFLGKALTYQKKIVKEGDELKIGKRTLKFIEAPMVRYPDVILTYDKYSKVLFSNNIFGNFGSYLKNEEPWDIEARRYYYLNLGKYGTNVRSVLNKIEKLDLKIILPIHGPAITENLKKYFSFYETWSKYIPEIEGVCIVFSSIYGHTKEAAEILAEKLKSLNVKFVLHDIYVENMSYALIDSFKYSKLVLASITYHFGLSPHMRMYINNLISRKFQSRNVSIIENGSWIPVSGEILKERLDICKNAKVNYIITLDSAVNEESLKKIDKLALDLAKN